MSHCNKMLLLEKGFFCLFGVILCLGLLDIQHELYNVYSSNVLYFITLFMYQMS